jgi:DNA-binding NarL/FixJ family response regulator
MKIVVIEDHALMRDLLLKACREAIAGSKVAGARDADSGLALCKRVQPDVVLLDLALPDRDGFELLQDLLTACPRAKFVGVSGYNDEFTLNRATQSKLHGFVDKNEQTADTLAEAIRTVMAGRRFLSPLAQEAHRSLRNDPEAFDKILSEREQTLLVHFGRGLTNHEIATALSLSELTVRNHRYRIMAKLGVKSSADLIRYALEKGFTRPPALRRASAKS